MKVEIELPSYVMNEIDRLIGERGRDWFIETAVERWLDHVLGRTIADKETELLKDLQDPDWSTPEKVSEWVHKQRRWESTIQDERIARWQEEAEEPPSE